MAVFSGMIGVTLFGVFLTPLFFYVVRRLTGTEGRSEPKLYPLQHPQCSLTFNRLAGGAQ